jgi:hypothetical protein
MMVTGEPTPIESIKSRISNIPNMNLDLHSQEFEEIHQDLTHLLSEIDGL